MSRSRDFGDNYTMRKTTKDRQKKRRGREGGDIVCCTDRRYL